MMMMAARFEKIWNFFSKCQWWMEWINGEKLTPLNILDTGGCLFVVHGSIIIESDIGLIYFYLDDGDQK